MNDIRRTILWVIFGFSMVMLWDKWQIHNGKQATFFPGATPIAAPAPAASAPDGVPSAIASVAASAQPTRAATGLVPPAATKASCNRKGGD